MSTQQRVVTAAGSASPADDAVSTPQRIVQAVIDGLTELDPASLTIQQVCGRAGVTAPTVYYHFGSKDGLIAAGVDALAARWFVELDQLIGQHDSLDEALARAVAAWHVMITAAERPFAVFVWVAMWSEESRAALVRAREQAQRLIRHAIATHLGEADDIDDLAGMLLDGVLGTSVEYQLDGDDDALRRRLSTLASMVRLRAAAASTSDDGSTTHTAPPAPD